MWYQFSFCLQHLQLFILNNSIVYEKTSMNFQHEMDLDIFTTSVFDVMVPQERIPIRTQLSWLAQKICKKM